MAPCEFDPVPCSARLNPSFDVPSIWAGPRRKQRTLGSYRHSVGLSHNPSPLRGEGWVWGLGFRGKLTDSVPPHPNPLPAGERGLHPPVS
jgi:hypothetical protein